MALDTVTSFVVRVAIQARDYEQQRAREDRALPAADHPPRPEVNPDHLSVHDATMSRRRASVTETPSLNILRT